MTPAILFIVYNRPELTARIFSAIRKARPEKLYIAADGPKRNHERDIVACHRVREIVSHVDWPCDVKTIFRKENQGCVQSVTSSITWFFDNEDEGIVLEDDCLPNPDFFRYCAELLARYRDDERVMVISGDNSIDAELKNHSSYAFVRFALVWGWASWARAWAHYNPASIGSDARNEAILNICKNENNFRIINENLEKIIHHRFDTWDYIWNFNIWAQKGLCVIPKENLISNIGFSKDATHTTDITDRRANRPMRSLKFPLIHPRIEINLPLEEEILAKIFTCVDDSVRKITAPGGAGSDMAGRRAEE